MIGFFARWGQALAAPRAALAGADDAGVSGRAAGDLLRAIAVVLVVAHTRELVATAWIGWELSWRDAAPGLLRAVSGASMFNLLFVVVAAPAVTVAAGRRRHLGRDFDLACVAALAPCTIGLAAAFVAQAVTSFGAGGRAVVLAGALGWGGALVALAIAQARGRRT